MSDEKPTYEDLECRLAKAEAIITALRNGDVHAVVSERDALLLRLRKAEEEIRGLARFPSENPNPVLRLSRDGTIIYANQSGERLLRVWDCNVGQTLREEIRRVAVDVSASDSTSNIEVECEGRTLLVTFAAVPHTECVNLYGLDITEGKRAEEALRESERELHITLDATTSGIYKWNFKTNVLFFSSRYYTMLGYDPGEFPATYEAWKSLIHPDDLAGVLRVAEEYLASKPDRYENEFRMRTKAGGYRWIHARSTVVERDERGNAVRIIGNHEDIAERKKVEEQLRESEERFRAIFDSARDGILAADVITKEFRFGNKAIHETLGYTPEELMALAIPDIHPQESLPAVIEAFAAQARGESQLAHDLPVLRKDGSVFYADINSSPLNLRGRAVLVGVFRDVTERKQAEEATRNAHEQLAEQRRREKERVEAELEKVRGELVRTTRLAAIGQVSASIAHDLRNPLGVATNAIYYLRHGSTKDASKTAEYLEMIDQEIGAANRIIGKLLDMAQDREPAKQAVDLAQVVEEVFGAAQEAGQMRYRTAMCPEPFVVEADPDQLRQVVGNLLSNAAEATKGRGEFLVEATRGPDGDTILFRDTGPGIDPGIRQSMFESLVTNKVHGTGLGLTICREIVQRHGGTIEAIDHQEGGAAFQIRLPRE